MPTTITQPEQEHIERLGEAFKEPTPQERFESWAKRAVEAEKKEEKKSSRLHEVKEADQKDKSDEEKQWLEKVGQKDEPESQGEKAAGRENDAAKESRGESAERAGAKPGANANAAADNAPSEPLSGDLAERHWQGALKPAEIEQHIHRVNTRAGLILDAVNRDPRKTEIEQGFKDLMVGKPAADPRQPGFFRDLTTALAECPDPGAVFRHIALQKDDREVIRNVKNARELRTAIQTIAKHYPGSAQQAKPAAAPKPRAPKPPGQVGDGAHTTDDGTRGESDFGNFSAKMRQKYHTR